LSSAATDPNVYTADTFEELAELTGVPVQPFVDEMAAYEA
jgi:hypothetical protein